MSPFRLVEVDVGFDRIVMEHRRESDGRRVRFCIMEDADGGIRMWLMSGDEPDAPYGPTWDAWLKLPEVEGPANVVQKYTLHREFLMEPRIRLIAAWAAILKVNSNGGQGVSLRSQRPASVAFPEFAQEVDEAAESLGWHYTRLPFEVARRMSSIPSEAVWASTRAKCGNPPIMPMLRANALLLAYGGCKRRLLYETSGYGNAQAAKVIEAVKSGVCDAVQ